MSAELELLGECHHANVIHQVVALLMKLMAGNLTPSTNELVLLLRSNLDTRFLTVEQL